MNIYKILPGLLLVLMFSCKHQAEREAETIQISGRSIEVQGHRGDRGNFPENSIPAFISAVKKGVDVIELDVVISKDKKVVISHEPVMSSLYVLTPAGDSIPKTEEGSYNLYQMTYDSIKKFDAGSRKNNNFSQQKNSRTYKPLLAEAIDSVESFIAAEDLKPIKYNIELKSVENEYNIYQPAPDEFVQLVMNVVQEKGLEDRVNIQSFDVNILKEMNKAYPDIELAYLVSNSGITKNLSLLGFTPEIYSPHYSVVKDDQFVDSIKNVGMELIPWTVNEKEDILRMVDLGVDGIITDYPERVIQEVDAK